MRHVCGLRRTPLGGGEISQKETTEQLPSTPLFAGVTAEDWPDLLGHSTRLDFSSGQAVFRQGDPAEAFFVVLAGLVEVRVKAKTGGDQILAHLGPGAVLGETGLFLGGQHSASLFATESTTILRFRKEGFMQMISERHRGAIQVLYNIGHTLSVRLRSADQHLSDGEGQPTATMGLITNDANRSGTVIN